MNLEALTQPEVAALLGVEERTLRNWAKEDPPLPSHGHGKALYYVWREVREWWRKREIQAYAPQGATPPLAESQARREAIKAEREALKLALERKELMRMEDWEHAEASRIAKVRLQLFSIPNRILPSHGREAAAQVEHEIVRALRILAGKADARS